MPKRSRRDALAPRCPVCRLPGALRNARQVYGRDIQKGGKGALIWCCEACDTRVGCHPRTKVPLGSMADAETRAWRKAAHAAFDPLWRNRSMRRSAAYALLADCIGTPQDQTHIGLFDVDRCKQVIAAMAWHRRDMREDAP